MREIVRQAIHLCFGLGIAALVFFIDHTMVLAVMAGGILIGVVLVDLILRGNRIPVISPLVSTVTGAIPCREKGRSSLP